LGESPHASPARASRLKRRNGASAEATSPRLSNCFCSITPQISSLDVSNEHFDKLEEIRRVTGIRIHAYTLIDRGAENLIIDVDDEWIFRFPRHPSHRDNLGKRLDFLASFSKRSPLAIPEPAYVTEHFVGYKKIPGTPLHPTQIERLRKDDKRQIAKQLGVFLAALHREHDERIDFYTGYLGKDRVGPRPCPSDFEQYLSATECRKLEARLQAIADNPLNTVQPTSVIHGDFYANNILWDRRKNIVTGIIDWGGMGLGIPAVDFAGLADFHTARNDDFLRTMLAWYGSTDDSLFNQIKACSIIDVMNWFWSYKHQGKTKGMERIVRKMKSILASDMVGGA
jgi:aminoglycoside 2''-phosphotransferase